MENPFKISFTKNRLFFLCRNMAFTAGRRCRTLHPFRITGFLVDFFMTADTIAMHGIFVDHDVFFVFFVFLEFVVACAAFLDVITRLEIQGFVVLIMMAFTTGYFVIFMMLFVAERQ